MKNILIGAAVVAMLFGGNLAFAQNQATLPSAGLTPESPFYFLDKLGENLQRFFTFNPESKVRLEITFAKERIAEIRIILEDKGVSAKGLSVAEERLSENLSRATAVLADRKQEGKDVSNLAKELSDDFGSAKEMLKDTFKSGRDVLNAKIDGLKAKIEAARLAGDTPQVEALSKEIADLNDQKDLLKQHKDKEDEDIKDKNDAVDETLDSKEAAAEKIRKAEEEKADVLNEAQESDVVLPDGSFGEFDNLLSQAKTAFDTGNYEDAKRMAKDARKNLKEAEKRIKDLKDSEEERVSKDEERKAEAQEQIGEAEKKRREIEAEAAKGGVQISTSSLAKFDRLLAQAKELLDKDNYVGAEQLAKQAKASLEGVKDEAERGREMKKQESENAKKDEELRAEEEKQLMEKERERQKQEEEKQ